MLTKADNEEIEKVKRKFLNYEFSSIDENDTKLTKYTSLIKAIENRKIDVTNNKKINNTEIVRICNDNIFKFDGQVSEWSLLCASFECTIDNDDFDDQYKFTRLINLLVPKTKRSRCSHVCKLYQLQNGRGTIEKVL